MYKNFKEAWIAGPCQGGVTSLFHASALVYLVGTVPGIKVVEHTADMLYLQIPEVSVIIYTSGVVDIYPENDYNLRITVRSDNGLETANRVLDILDAVI